MIYSYLSSMFMGIITHNTGFVKPLSVFSRQAAAIFSLKSHKPWGIIGETRKRGAGQ